MLWTLAFWKGAGERAVKTFAQVLVGFFAVGTTTGLFDIDWPTALSVAGASTVASLLTSIGNADFTAGAQVVTVTPEEVVAAQVEDHPRSHAENDGPDVRTIYKNG